MTKQLLLRASSLATVATLSFLGCSSSDDDDDDTTNYPGDPLAAMESQCDGSLQGKGCDRQCILDSLNVNEFNGAVCEESKPLDFATLSAYNDCTDACPVTKTCGSTSHRDCACSRDCAGKHLSRRTQGLLAFHGDCIKKLPSCQ